MTVELREIGRSIPLPGSPLSALNDWIGAELAAESIPCSCPHPAGAYYLYLPSRILCCAECFVPLQGAIGEWPPRCAICTAPAARVATWIAGNFYVSACLCDACGTTGNTPMSPN